MQKEPASVCAPRSSRRGRALLLALAAAVAPPTGLAAQPADGEGVPVRVALLHMAPVLGRLTPNIDTLTAMAARAFAAGADLVVGPELATTGYSITAGQIRDSLGLRAPFARLAGLRDLAMRNDGYVAVGIAEIADDDSLYNSVVLFQPDGRFVVQRKRGASGFGPRGDLPFTVVPTRFGELGLVICSDTYLQDWPRILALAGADLILSPANWWGGGQLNLWTARAHENDVHLVVANRWGTETDTRFGTPFHYDMNDAPSVVVAPGRGDDQADPVRLVYRTATAPEPRNVVLRHTLFVPRARIGGGPGRAYTVRARQPGAYVSLSNRSYRPDLGSPPAPGLPPAGETRVAVLALRPGFDPAANVARIRAGWAAGGGGADVLVLPARAVTPQPLDTAAPGWAASPPWDSLQAFVDRSGLRLLATSVFEATPGGVRESLVVMRPGEPPLVRPAIHPWPPAGAAPQEPLYLDLSHARVGVVLGRDLLFPETSLDLAKRGADLVLAPAAEGVLPPRPTPVTASPWPYNAWQVRANDGLHVAAVNRQGWGLVVRSAGGVNDKVVVADADAGTALRVLSLDSGSVRAKFLNAYHDFDLRALGLPPTAPLAAAPPPQATRRAAVVPAP
jgi:predicted amidohydrolase